MDNNSKSPGAGIPGRKIRAPLVIPLARAVAVIGPFMVAVGAYTTWAALNQQWYPAWEIWTLDSLGAVFALGLIWLACVWMICESVTLYEDRLVVSERTFIPGKLDSRTVHWEELHEPTLNIGIVTVKASDPFAPLSVSLEQAKAILADRRYTHRDEIPPEVAKKIGSPSRRGVG